MPEGMLEFHGLFVLDLDQVWYCLPTFHSLSVGICCTSEWWDQYPQTRSRPFLKGNCMLLAFILQWKVVEPCCLVATIDQDRIEASGLLRALL